MGEGWGGPVLGATPAPGAGRSRPDRTAGAGELTVGAPVALLLLTLALGTLWQGAFPRPAQLAVGLGVAGCLVVSFARSGRAAVLRGLTDPLAVPVGMLLGLAAWMVLDDAARGRSGAGAVGAALAVGVAAVVVVVRRARAGDRELLVLALPVLGAPLAVTSWAGLVLHVPRWSLHAQGLVRGSGALTYPNATAAVLVVLALLALARCAPDDGRPRPAGATGAVLPTLPPRLMRLLAAALLLGAGTTLSRGGLVALQAGTAVLLVARGPALRALPGPLAGAAVALAGALPATTSGAGRPGPVVLLVAVAALVAGGIVVELVTALTVRRRPAPGADRAGADHGGRERIRSAARARRRRRVRSAGLAVLLAVTGLGIAVAGPRWDAVAAARMTATSSHRLPAARAALAVIAEHPLAGVGPADSAVSWRRADGARLTATYLHDEYLQVLLEYGVVGAVLLLAVLLSGAVLGLRRGLGSDPARVAGAAAAAAFGVHSALDFLWHLPVLPLLVAAAVTATLLAPAADRGPGAVS